MEVGWLAGAGVALVGGLCYWVWKARRAGAARDSLSGYLIGDQVSGVGSSHHSHHHHHDSGGSSDSGDSGGGDGGVDA